MYRNYRICNIDRVCIFYLFSLFPTILNPKLMAIYGLHLSIGIPLHFSVIDHLISNVSSWFDEQKPILLLFFLIQHSYKDLQRLVEKIQ